MDIKRKESSLTNAVVLIDQNTLLVINCYTPDGGFEEYNVFYSYPNWKQQALNIIKKYSDLEVVFQGKGPQLEELKFDYNLTKELKND